MKGLECSYLPNFQSNYLSPWTVTVYISSYFNNAENKNNISAVIYSLFQYLVIKLTKSHKLLLRIDTQINYYFLYMYLICHSFYFS